MRKLVSVSIAVAIATVPLASIAQAKRLIDGRAVELWNGPRFVIKLESDPK